MEIKMRYFGLLAETLQKEEEIITTQAKNIGDLKNELLKRYPTLENKTFVLAQQNSIKAEEEKLLEQEVALFPPFSGG
ncbi:MAG: molybdopterin synthase sulfur carrier subunit [Flavobacteriales bacterium MED-G22]|jgi:molybdopterin converting factor small subunit|nr:MoaD/ThiS family protein [Flavobacteriaceae bacterium]PDH44921.1 MAG: molybdopterin synthase sulfur carrier subunit [Flavobacteriales bacterium MED-G22]|tara:strand:+ start:13659 stop:13892 length:234 start_codon:yes stop_codon:yes gene_type:complete